MRKTDKVINKLFYDKLTAARDMTRLSQQEIAQYTGLSQPRISRIERGEGVFVPNNYLVLLWGKGINLNDLFNDNITVEEFRVKFQDRHAKSFCADCKDKDERIRELKDSNKVLLEMIDMLKKSAGHCDSPRSLEFRIPKGKR